ncbi:MAG: hypothetical protein KDK78_11190 [Chlamydiia bacterium]|nr:hypothetical protein [Chlamydiia bacterium]
MCDRAVEDPEALEAYLEAQRLALLILFGDEEIQAEARAEWERQDLDAYLYLLGVCVN